MPRLPFVKLDTASLLARILKNDFCYIISGLKFNVNKCHHYLRTEYIVKGFDRKIIFCLHFPKINLKQKIWDFNNMLNYEGNRSFIIFEIWARVKKNIKGHEYDAD